MISRAKMSSLTAERSVMRASGGLTDMCLPYRPLRAFASIAPSSDEFGLE
jgi:hypothetical protein